MGRRKSRRTLSANASLPVAAVLLVPTVTVGLIAAGLAPARAPLAAFAFRLETRLLRSFSTPCSRARERRVVRRVCMMGSREREGSRKSEVEGERRGVGGEDVTKGGQS
jgi:hypothetical protein